MSEDESRPWKSMKRAEAVLFLRAQQDTLTPEETADAMVFLQNQDTLARLLSPDPVIPVNSAVGTSFVCFDSIVHPVVGSRSSAQLGSLERGYSVHQLTWRLLSPKLRNFVALPTSFYKLDAERFRRWLDEQANKTFSDRHDCLVDTTVELERVQTRGLLVDKSLFEAVVTLNCGVINLSECDKRLNLISLDEEVMMKRSSLIDVLSELVTLSKDRAVLVVFNFLASLFVVFSPLLRDAFRESAFDRELHKAMAEVEPVVVLAMFWSSLKNVADELRADRRSTSSGALPEDDLVDIFKDPTRVWSWMVEKLSVGVTFKNITSWTRTDKVPNAVRVLRDGADVCDPRSPSPSPVVGLAKASKSVPNSYVCVHHLLHTNFPELNISCSRVNCDFPHVFDSDLSVYKPLVERVVRSAHKSSEFHVKKADILALFEGF